VTRTTYHTSTPAVRTRTRYQVHQCTGVLVEHSVQRVQQVHDTYRERGHAAGGQMIGLLGLARAETLLTFHGLYHTACGSSTHEPKCRRGARRRMLRVLTSSFEEGRLPEMETPPDNPKNAYPLDRNTR
ncbi:unnamed protein product, partial [Laminaria digitata]